MMMYHDDFKETQAMQRELVALDVEITWEQLGSVSLDAIIHYCNERRIPALARIKLEYLWTQHPHRSQRDSPPATQATAWSMFELCCMHCCNFSWFIAATCLTIGTYYAIPGTAGAYHWILLSDIFNALGGLFAVISGFLIYPRPLRSLYAFASNAFGARVNGLSTGHIPTHEAAASTVMEYPSALRRRHKRHRKK